MASTSTNKQPLLVDHVFHKVVTLDLATNAPNAEGIPDVSPTNSAELMLDVTNADGAIVVHVERVEEETLRAVRGGGARANFAVRSARVACAGGFPARLRAVRNDGLLMFGER